MEDILEVTVTSTSKICLKCSVKNCPSSRFLGNNMGKRFFSFPRPDDTGRVLQWKLACSDEEIMKKDPASLKLSNRICSDHFEKRFMTTHKLNKTAAPTLNLFLKPRSVDVETQTENSVEIQLKKQITHTQTQTTKELSFRTPREDKLSTLLKSKTKMIRKLNMEKQHFEKCLEAICSQET
ncbi:uncharacterized protein LOC123320534 [Coccinella septempunctata]|uniref:uncharacterized protein LOC123320534 n=1 Tax=Coccinella septempunctata TaxID=41139 RepID=UPI001D098435|nr:uncharacterized protein LOC123320534 [Coccinella septempunctata]